MEKYGILVTIYKYILDTFDIDGDVRANGEDAANQAAGGGSGGSIWIYSNIIKGYGRLTAHGGDGNPDTTNPGSGGGGGRIALYFRLKIV